MSILGRKKASASPSAPQPIAPTPSEPNWKEISAVRAEWPLHQLDAEAQLAGWHEAQRLYDNDDYASMMRCADLYSRALAHNLYGAGILKDDLPETVFRTLYCALNYPPDGQTFAETAQRAARLALIVMRENGWQPKHMGGSGIFPDEFMMDKGNYMLLGTAIAPPGRPWEGDLKGFFAVRPEQVTVAIAPRNDSMEVVDRVYGAMKDAEAGDAASEHYMTGLGLTAAGRTEEAVEAFAASAGLGYVPAMHEAGVLLLDLGRPTAADFWFQAAAAAGHPVAMFNVGVGCWERGDIATAEQWMAKAAEAGNPQGYAALTQMARDRGDDEREMHWAHLGAEAGDTFCLKTYGCYLCLNSRSNPSGLRQALAYLSVAANRGDIDALLMAGAACGQLGDEVGARDYFDRARATGDPKALAKLEKWGH